jgi:hypothetical protein
MNIPVDSYLNEFTTIWNEESLNAAFQKRYFNQEKEKCEQLLLQQQATAKNDQGNNDTPELKEALLKAYKSDAVKIFEHCFGFDQDETEIILGKGFTKSTRDFIRMAKDFDPQLSYSDIFQAGRNVWIVNSLQHLMGETVQITPAIFAYSMLYPYTDNYLDDSSIDCTTKNTFSKRFKLRLEGKIVLPFNQLESKIFDLVGMIESQYSSKKYPAVYESLLAIHHAQTRSIALTHAEKPDCNELLSICIDKGGTSVLADGYLINGKLTRDQEWFMYGFGAYLQFIDDLQDLQNDEQEGVATAFTHAAHTDQLELFVSRTLGFCERINTKIQCFNSPVYPPFTGLIRKSTHFMIIEAIAKNKQYYKPGFLTDTEKYSPVSFDFMEKNRSAASKISVTGHIKSFLSRIPQLHDHAIA